MPGQTSFCNSSGSICARSLSAVSTLTAKVSVRFSGGAEACDIDAALRGIRIAERGVVGGWNEAARLRLRPSGVCTRQPALGRQAWPARRSAARPPAGSAAQAARPRTRPRSPEPRARSSGKAACRSTEDRPRWPPKPPGRDAPAARRSADRRWPAPGPFSPASLSDVRNL